MRESEMLEGGEYVLEPPALRRHELLVLRDGALAGWDQRYEEIAIWNFQLRSNGVALPRERRARAKRPRQTLRQRVAEILRRNGEWTRG